MVVVAGCCHSTRLLGVGGMRVGHRYGRGHREWTLVLAALVQRIVQRELTAQDEFERPWNLGINCWRDRYKRRCTRFIFTILEITSGKYGKKDTYSRYFSSADRSRTGMPDRKRMIRVVKIGDRIATHSMPSMTFSEITKIPHQITISPK
uniref:Uncharacterized protein n=1 Tax=Anopheles culicifacies TaxID=139723 RepID=A0A182MR40_9DIPT